LSERHILIHVLPHQIRRLNIECNPRDHAESAQPDHGSTEDIAIRFAGELDHVARRGFMAGAMKKAGYAVESFKPEGGERTYRINK
jgi:hypothetical protein